MTAILWFRRDLRLHDHPALNAAIEDGQQLVPVFCFDDRLLHGRHASGPRTQFLLECLEDLDGSLRERDSHLVIRRGGPERELPSLATELGARSFHFTDDVGPYARQRDARVARALSGAQIDVQTHPGLFVTEDLCSIRTGADAPYTVFTPFHRAWGSHPRRQPLAAPRELPPLPKKLYRGKLPRLRDLKLAQEAEAPLTGGERAARERVKAFVAGPVKHYESGRDMVAGEGVSRLSPYLRFGCISPRELEERLPRGNGAAGYRRQLCWRDFYAQVLLHFPANARSEYQERYRGKLRWSYAHKRFEGWCEGRTGYPMVDAAMRQLRREGWMRNRARLLVGSFLTKDLGIDWRWGERWFMRRLIDGDEASNNGNWQWIASVGVDPQPAFRRVYNPARQQARFDPDGLYVRRYVPELADVPDEYLAEPWTMPEDVQRHSECVIGRDYPRPIVDHVKARKEALSRYAEAGRD